MLKVVFDTVVFVRGLINPHSRWGQAVFGHFPRYCLFVSKEILVEILEVLRRPELTRKFSTLKNKNTRRIIEILSEAEAVEIESVPHISRDPKDNKFLATAQAADADYLVTEDKDLLILKEFEGTKIIDIATFLQILERNQ